MGCGQCQCGNKCKCGKCSSHKGMMLCPISLGLAFGITGGLAVLLGAVWAMYYGISPMMAQLHIPIPTFTEAGIHSLWSLLKGFILGFFVALFYDFFICIKSKCCRRSKCECCGPKTDKVEPGM